MQPSSSTFQLAATHTGRSAACLADPEEGGGAGGAAGGGPDGAARGGVGATPLAPRRRSLFASIPRMTPPGALAL